MVVDCQISLSRERKAELLKSLQKSYKLIICLLYGSLSDYTVSTLHPIYKKLIFACIAKFHTSHNFHKKLSDEENNIASVSCI